MYCVKCLYITHQIHQLHVLLVSDRNETAMKINGNRLIVHNKLEMIAKIRQENIQIYLQWLEITADHSARAV
jgi:hypothetical protein